MTSKPNTDNAGQQTRHMRRKIADELRAILSSDGKAKEGGV